MNYSYLKSKRFLWPTGLMAVFLVVGLLLLQYGPTKYTSLQRTLIQWDGVHYLSIARDGYEKFPCDYDPTYICGNVGWFPMYPLVSRLLMGVGITAGWSVLLTSWLSLWGALLVLFYLFESVLDRKAALFGVIALLLFPSSFYFLTAFPYSQYLLLSSVTLLLLYQKRFWWMALPTGLLAVTYPSGIIIALPLLWVLVRDRKKLSTNDRVGILISLFSIAAALLLYFGYNWYRFDDFLLYNHFQAQSYYAHQPTFPLVTILRSLRDVLTPGPVTIMLVFIILVTGLFYTRKIPVEWQLLMLAALLFTPSMGTTDCYYRHVVIAFPLFAMIGVSHHSKWRWWLFGAYIIAALWLAGSVFMRAYRLGELM